MAAPGILDAEAEGRRLEAADQPVDDSGDVWTEHFGPPQSEVANDQPSPTTGGGRRLRPQSTSATDPVGTQMLGGDGLPLINATQPIINLEVDAPSMPGGPSMPPGINTGGPLISATDGPPSVPLSARSFLRVLRCILLPHH